MDWKAPAAQKGRHFLPIVPISESYYRAHFHLVKAHFAGKLVAWSMFLWPTFPSMADPLDFARESEQEDISHWPASFCLVYSYRMSFLRLSSLSRVAALCRWQCSRKAIGRSPSAPLLATCPRYPFRRPSIFHIVLSRWILCETMQRLRRCFRSLSSFYACARV